MRIKRIAYFVSPHGFGHAARAAAVMEALSEIDTGVQFEIFTTVPFWFFRDSTMAIGLLNSRICWILLPQNATLPTAPNRSADLSKTP
jgi:hypothetical protein